MHYRRWQKHGSAEYTNPKCNRDGNATKRNRARTTAWKKTNWAYYKAYLQNRKGRVRLATPKWADIESIVEFYRNCPKGYHVDHIIPINGKNVSGLHVLSNLQYLPALENMSKGNSF